MSLYVTHSQTETEQLGYRLMAYLSYGRYPVILLDGELAAGKTTFTKGIAKQLGISKVLNSPTYTILKTYVSDDSMKHLHHMDLYRLHTLGQDVDLEDYMYGKQVTVIEWPFQVNEILPNDYILVSFKTVDLNIRHIEITCHGRFCESKDVNL